MTLPLRLKRFQAVSEAENSVQTLSVCCGSSPVQIWRKNTHTNTRMRTRTPTSTARAAAADMTTPKPWTAQPTTGATSTGTPPPLRRTPSQLTRRWLGGGCHRSSARGSGSTCGAGEIPTPSLPVRLASANQSRPPTPRTDDSNSSCNSCSTPRKADGSTPSCDRKPWGKQPTSTTFWIQILTTVAVIVISILKVRDA